MKMYPFFRPLLPCIAFLLGAFVFLALPGCFSSSGGGGASDNDTITQTADLGTAVKNVQLLTGQSVEIAFTYTLPGDISAQGDFTGNLTETLRNRGAHQDMSRCKR